ncbi:hypothetical protein MHYP_G00015680 [Metynnis hypsauchen]
MKIAGKEGGAKAWIALMISVISLQCLKLGRRKLEVLFVSQTVCHEDHHQCSVCKPSCQLINGLIATFIGHFIRYTYLVSALCRGTCTDWSSSVAEPV